MVFKWWISEHLALVGVAAGSRAKAKNAIPVRAGIYYDLDGSDSERLLGSTSNRCIGRHPSGGYLPRSLEILFGFAVGNDLE